MKRIVTAVMLLAIGCSNTDRGAEPNHAIDARHARIQRLVTSCTTADQASLILMATGRFDWGDGIEEQPARASLDDPPVDPELLSVRCHATLVLASTPMTWLTDNMGALEKRAAALSGPNVIEGLLVMLRDGKTGCSGTYGRNTIEPRTVFPKRAVRDVLFMAPIVTSSPRNDDLDLALLPIRGEIDGYHPTSRVRRLDESVADLSPASFEKVLEMLDPTFAWNDGNPPPTEAERAEIQEHGLVAMHWAFTLAQHAAPPDFGSDRPHYVPNDCEVELYSAIKTGALGDAMRTRANSFPEEIRRRINTYLAYLHALRKASP